MTTELVDQLFRSRYRPAIRLCRKIQFTYILLALLFFTICFALRIRIWWSFLLVFGGYIALRRLLFKKWSPAAIRERILLATEKATATVTETDSSLGIHQVAYRYQWNSWNFKATDMVAPSEVASFSPGQQIDIRLDPLRPKQSYIVPPPDQLVG